jgi:protein-tyrosine-phosphatase
MFRVLFVCTANICRSAYMEQVARRLAGTGAAVTFASAGTHGFTDHPMDEVMATTLEGPDAAFRSRPLTREIVDGADLVLTAEATHRAFVLEEFPHAFRRVFTVGQFAAAVEASDGLRGRALVEAAGARRTASLPEHDIADPYGRGNSAAAAVAGRMSTMLSVIVPALVEEA